jgi:IclR family transcriptional regulator, KDG regulon repressor
VTDPRLLRGGLEQIRKAKFFVSRGEINDDLISITAPGFVAPGKIIAALNIAAPENRVPEERISELGDMVARAAHRISAALGFRSPAANEVAS